ncbi:MAG TPA: dihydropteroate synthase [Oceanospirillales bacterium]|nr:dihydropteroate synthase [Oceanospirillales bacterium]
MAGRNYKIMGVINVTPDSFSDGGDYFATEKALAHALTLIQQGADIIDVGGESTRPGAQTVSYEDEISRIIPVISALRQQQPNICISVDSSKAQVMQAAIAAGADFINDINALGQQGSIEIAAKASVPVCLMHKQGQPKTMQNKPQYTDVLMEVMDFFKSRIDNCLSGGIKAENIILDPGIGFGKTLEHNLTLLRNIGQFKTLGFPLLIGVSRKSMIGEILDADLDKRLYGSLAIAQYSYMQGAEILRVHDVKATADVLKTTQTLLNVDI